VTAAPSTSSGVGARGEASPTPEADTNDLQGRILMALGWLSHHMDESSVDAKVLRNILTGVPLDQLVRDRIAE
jgi:hypothetical protein